MAQCGKQSFDIVCNAPVNMNPGVTPQITLRNLTCDSLSIHMTLDNSSSFQHHSVLHTNDRNIDYLAGDSDSESSWQS